MQISGLKEANETLEWEWHFPAIPNFIVLGSLLLNAPPEFALFQVFMIWIFWDKLEWDYGLELSDRKAD